MKAMITYFGVLDMQVCVPWEWTDEQVVDFANTKNPCGTEAGWVIRKQGDRMLGNTDERVQCNNIPENCHIMLDA